MKMAKRKVICQYCRNKFDRDEDEYPLPEAEYIDGSFEREEDIEIIELNNV